MITGGLFRLLVRRLRTRLLPFVDAGDQGPLDWSNRSRKSAMTAGFSRESMAPRWTNDGVVVVNVALLRPAA